MSDGIYVPWDDINEFDTLPDGCYQLEAKSEVGESGAGKLMVKNQFTVILPAEMAGRVVFEYMTLGTDEAPKSFVKDAPGGGNFKKCMKAAQVPPGSLEQMVAGLNSSQFMADVKEIQQANDASFRPGERINKIVAYHKVGERDAVLKPSAGSAVGRQVSQAPAPPAPTQQGTIAPPAAVQQTAPIAPPVQTAAPQQVAPAQTQVVQPAPVAPALVQQVAAPAVNPAPATVVPAAPVPTPPAPATGGQMMKCTICGVDVPIADFAEHVRSHMQK